MVFFRNGSTIKTLIFLTVLTSQLLLALALPVGSSLRRDTTAGVRLIQYVQTFRQNADPSKRLSLLPLLRNKTSVTHVILAALHVNAAPGDITLNDQSPAAPYYGVVWSEVKTLQRKGVKVMVMMGGAARGSYNNRLCSSDGQLDTRFYEPLLEFLTDYGLDGIDLDIEEPVSLQCAVSIITTLKKDMGPTFLITLAPVASDLTPTMRGLSGFNYHDLETASAAGPLVDWYNTQYYSGFVEGSVEQSYGAAVANGFAPSRVVAGLLSSAEAGAGWLDIEGVRGAVENLRREYDDVGGVDGWEYFDAGSSDGFNRPTRWLKEIGKTLLTGTAAGPHVSPDDDGRADHVPPLPGRVRELMDEGYDQIEAAAMARMQKGHDI